MRLVKYRDVWSVYYEGKRASLHTKDRDIAERRFQDWKRQYLSSQDTISEICERYKAYIIQRGGADQKYRLKSPIEYFGKLTPEHITREKCTDYIKFRGKTGQGTINTELGALRAALRWHDRNTKAEFYIPPKPSPKDRYLTKDEYQKLLAGAKLPHVKLFLILALGTGARVTALLELTWDRVDFDKRMIVLSKGDEAANKRRATIPMNESVFDALDFAYKEARTCDYVIEFGSHSVKSIKKGVKAAANRAGLKNVSPHVLRHTAGVWLAEAGISMPEISQYLGHTSTKITEKVYARYSPEYQQKSANVLQIQNT